MYEYDSKPYKYSHLNTLLLLQIKIPIPFCFIFHFNNKYNTYYCRTFANETTQLLPDNLTKKNKKILLKPTTKHVGVFE